MKTVDITLQTDEYTMSRFEEFCSDVGLNVPTAFNIFIRAVLRERKIPFDIVSDNKLSPEREDFVKLLYEMRTEAEKRGFLSDEEIEFEIQAAKKEIRERELKEQKELQDRRMATI